MCAVWTVVRAFTVLLALGPAVDAADAASAQRMPGVHAAIVVSSNSTRLRRGQDVSLSCLVTFPHMFALYDPYIMHWQRATADSRWITLSTNDRLQSDVDKRKYAVCYKRPHRFRFLLNYTLHIRDFSESDEGDYRCEGIDNDDDPLWPLNADIYAGRLTLAAESDELHAVNGKEHVRSCTAGGFLYHTRSTNCVYYSERNIKKDITVIAPCPAGTAFDLTACRCRENAICWHASLP